MGFFLSERSVRLKVIGRRFENGSHIYGISSEARFCFEAILKRAVFFFRNIFEKKGGPGHSREEQQSAASHIFRVCTRTKVSEENSTVDFKTRHISRCVHPSYFRPLISLPSTREREGSVLHMYNWVCVKGLVSLVLFL